MNDDNIEVLTNEILTQDDTSVKRIIAESMKHGGLKSITPYSNGGKKVTYIEWLSTMVWDGITEGNITFADGSSLNLSAEPKLWLDLVKFISVHLDGQVNANAQFNGVNIFKVYKGIDPDMV